MTFLSEHFALLLLITDWLIRIFAFLWIPSRSNPAAARTWLLLVVFLPLIGLPMYLMFGHPWLSKKLHVRYQHALQQRQQDQRALADFRWHADSNSSTSITTLTENLGHFIPTQGNSVQLMSDYMPSLQSLIHDIDQAQHEIHMLYYLMHKDDVGEAIVDALIRARQRGVDCRVLLDAIGAKQGLDAYQAKLRTHGIEIHAALKHRFFSRSNARIDLRNHRKITVIDRHTGYVGSQNLSRPDFVPGHPNRELVARVHGPVVTQLASVFANDWYIETGVQLSVESDVQKQGDHATQLMPSAATDTYENARSVVIAMIQQAQHRVVLATPYFVPDAVMLNAVCMAALSGKDVQLILSATNNQRVTAFTQESYYEELLSAGVRIALYRPHFLHAKHLSVDDSMLMLGSINLDIRSFRLNEEIGMLCYDTQLTQQLHQIEQDYLQHSDALTLDVWRQRNHWRRYVESIARLTDSFL